MHYCLCIRQTLNIVKTTICSSSILIWRSGIVGSLHCGDLVVMLSSNHVIAGSTRASAVVFKVSACK